MTHLDSSIVRARPCESQDTVSAVEVRLHLLLLVSCLSILIVSVLLHPNGARSVTLLGATLPELCGFHRLTGWNCPGCGLTHSVMSISQGKWIEAWNWNPAGPFFYVLIAFQVPYRLYALWCYRCRRRPSGIPWSGALIGAAFAILIVQWILRLLSP